jgi:TonB family protein
MGEALANWESVANTGEGFAEPRPPCGTFVLLPSRQLAAVTVSLVAHGFLVAALMLEALPHGATLVRVIPVEVVMEQPGTVNQRAADSPKDNSERPTGTIQIQPERMGNLDQKTAAQLGLDPALERAARELQPDNKRLPRAKSQPAAADPFRAVAVPVPSEGEGEAMSYQLIVGGMLERVKHYPERALQHGVKGRAVISFVLDRSGGVASVILLRSSGDAELDAESVALVERAAPFPAAPPGAQHSFTVEVAFGMGN